jgi:hypothetical protein
LTLGCFGIRVLAFYQIAELVELVASALSEELKPSLG